MKAESCIRLNDDMESKFPVYFKPEVVGTLLTDCRFHENEHECTKLNKTEQFIN